MWDSAYSNKNNRRLVTLGTVLTELNHGPGTFTHTAFGVAAARIIIVIIKGHSLQRACLQPAMNTQNSKPRPPTTNARSKGKLEINQSLLETQHRLTTPLHTSRCSARLVQSRGRSICSVRPRLSMSCMAVSIHVRWGHPMGLGWPRMECAKSSCLTMTYVSSRT